MQIAVLVDNNTADALQAEWGLSLYIEYEGHTILLDAGTTGIFADNAKALGTPVENIELAVLSHAHYDHGDGLERFFEENKKAKCYIRSCCGEDCYDRKKDKYIGIKAGLFKTYGERFARIEGDYTLLPGVTLVPHKTQGLEKLGEKVGMYRYRNGVWIPDDFSHEQSLVFETKKGLVICNSCCHGGADRIIEEVKQTLPDKRVYALIGGLHLYRASDEEVLTLAEKIRETGIEKIYTGHCTGERALERLKETLGSAVRQFYTGMEIEI
ncbi:MAG: MBL fold metallo-hydrolase [Lachnospiraceae bacterium]|nr:MBL fold metallo-hydrolase [Lachnospiraceae bacterium]